MMGVEGGTILLLIVLNLRGVKESVTFLLPIFIDLPDHARPGHQRRVGLHLRQRRRRRPRIATKVRKNVDNPKVGIWGMLGLFLHAYSMGGRHVHRHRGRVEQHAGDARAARADRPSAPCSTWPSRWRSTAGGLMIAYLLLGIHASRRERQDDEPVAGQQCRRRHRPAGNWFGGGFVLVTIISEGALLFVAAQAGFIDGPRVLANMAHDSWMPHWFAQPFRAAGQRTTASC